MVVGLFAHSANAEMIYTTATRTIGGSGTQLEEMLETHASLGSYTDDLLSSGYVRDDGNAIVGSVSSSSSQTSTLSDNQIRGLGRGSGFGSGPAEGVGNSSMNVEFSVTETTRFSLAGQLRLAPHGGALGLNGSTAYVRLTGPDGVALEVMMDEDNQPDNLGIVDFSGSDQLSGVFPAGDYVLEAFSEGHGSDGLTRCADFDFTLSVLEVAAVPEPAAFSLMAFAGLALMRLRKRRR
jgi:hypothetical protein